MTEKIENIVKYLLDTADIENETHMQCLVYYAYGWHLGITGKELTKITWIAKAEGPWSPEVNKAYNDLIEKPSAKI